MVTRSLDDFQLKESQRTNHGEVPHTNLDEAGQRTGEGRPVNILRVYEKTPAAQAAEEKEKAQPPAAK